MDPIATARYGMMAATRRFEASAVRTAQSAPGEADYGFEVTEQISAKHQFSAALGVIRVADEMWDALLDLQSERR